MKNKFALVPETRSQIRVLIVPGHEPDFGGAEYRDLLERELNLELALKLNKLLSMDGRFEVLLSRDENGWNKELVSYFANNWESIKSFAQEKKDEMQSLILDGRLTKVEGLYHNEAPSGVATRLYGINKWSGEKGVEILIHIHLNDHPRSNVNRPGKYWGFAIYVPEKQYSNSLATRHLAEYIHKSLSEEFDVSNYPKEAAGIIESPDLIAIGNANTLDGASVLMEYGYIYRPAFQDKQAREETFDKMARLTYLGLIDFFVAENR